MGTVIQDTGRGRALRPVLLALTLAMGAALVTGCAGGRLGGSSLSEAVEEARDSDRDRDGRKKRDGDRPKKRRKVLHAGLAVPEPPVVVVERGRGRRPRRERPRQDREPALFNAGLALGRASFGGREIERSRFLALHVGGTVPQTRQRVELGVDLAGAALDLEPRFGPSLRDVGELSLGFSARYYAGPPGQAAAFYGTAGLNLGALWWDYASPILIEDYREVYEVDGDWIGTYSPYVGMGFTLFQRGGMQFGTSMIAGYKLFEGHTHEGLYNDLFEPAPFVQVRFELGHAIR